MCDGTFPVPHCAAMLRSLITNEREPFSVHLFVEEDVSADVIQRLGSMFTRPDAGLIVRPVPHNLIGDLVHSGPGTTWTRAFLPEVLTELDRVIYLDCDLIVTDSLRPLWVLALGDSCIGAVTTVFPAQEWGQRHCLAMGVPSTREYFSAGVLLMNLRHYAPVLTPRP